MLVTIGILALRAPPRLADFRLENLAAAVLVLGLISLLSSVTLGLALPGPQGGSDNPYLPPDNALRLAKGFVTALALLPFLRARMRTHGDALAWLSAGMTTGLCRRCAGSPRRTRRIHRSFRRHHRIPCRRNLLQHAFRSRYIGAHIAIALPFLLVCLLRPRPFTLFTMFGIAIAAGYALVVSYARTAYAAGIAFDARRRCGMGMGARHRTTGIASSLALSALVPLTIGGILSLLRNGFMAKRLQDSGFRSRRFEKKTGAAVWPCATITWPPSSSAQGWGPSADCSHAQAGRPLSNFVVAEDGGYRILSLHARLPIYLGQKVRVQPNQQYRLSLALRSPDGKGVLTAILCEKCSFIRQIAAMRHLASTFLEDGRISAQ